MRRLPISGFPPTEGRAYFATFLDRQRIPWRIVALDAGESVPPTLDDTCGIAMMGGPMSVNDDLPWVEPLAKLLRKALVKDVPVIGHCLGGQMLAKAIGVPVTRSPHVEIGWHGGQVESAPGAAEWFGKTQAFRTFQGANESFALP